MATPKFGLTIAQFLEQTRILDGDYGLVGEGGSQLNFLGRERIDARAVNRKYTDQRLLAQ